MGPSTENLNDSEAQSRPDLMTVVVLPSWQPPAMVYRGPSRGCAECKRRRVKCDEQLPECRNCLRRHICCTGARPQVEFLDETATIIKSQQAQNAKISRPSLLSASKDDAQSQRSRTISVASAGTMHPGTFSLPQSPEGSAYDPFGAFAIRADANVHDMLLFWRHSIEGPVYEVREQDTRQPLQQLARKAWDLSIRSMRNETQAYSLLLLAASMKTRIINCERTTRLSLQWYNRVTSTLRKVLIPRAKVSLMIALVGTLLAAELILRNPTVAEFHAKFLFHHLWPSFLAFAVGGQVTDYVTPHGLNMALCLNMLTKTRSNSAITPRDVHTALLIEVQRAVSAFTKPMIDFRFVDLGQMNLHGSNELSVPEPFLALDRAAFTDLNLLKHFEDVRTHLGGLFKSTENSIDLSRTYCVQTSTYILILTSRLLEYSIAASEKARTWVSQAPRCFDGCQNAAASLAALYWVRLITRNEPYEIGNGSAAFSERMYAVGPQLALRIAKLLEMSADTARALIEGTGRVDGSSLNHTLSPALRLRLWILHIGSFIESTSKQGGSNSNEGYNHKEYRSMLTALGIDVKLKSVNTILQGFLPLHEHDIQRPVWLSPILRTWGLSNNA